MVIEKDKYITIAYEFRAPDGSILGSSEYSGPFTFRQGYGDVVPGLDSRLEGKRVGEQHSFVIPPEEGYGTRDDALISTLPRQALPLGRDPEVGMRVNASDRVMIITEVTDETITLDANHPLAGIPLHFDVRVLAVDDEAPVADDHSCGCGGTCGCH